MHAVEIVSIAFLVSFVTTAAMCSVFRWAARNDEKLRELSASMDSENGEYFPPDN